MIIRQKIEQAYAASCSVGVYNQPRTLATDVKYAISTPVVKIIIAINWTIKKIEKKTGKTCKNTNGKDVIWYAYTSIKIKYVEIFIPSTYFLWSLVLTPLSSLMTPLYYNQDEWSN